jgi:hypothetical protein
VSSRRIGRSPQEILVCPVIRSSRRKDSLSMWVRTVTIFRSSAYSCVAVADVTAATDQRSLVGHGRKPRNRSIRRREHGVGAGLRPWPVAPPTAPRLVGSDLAHHPPTAGTGHHPHRRLQGGRSTRPQKVHTGACLSSASCEADLGLRACSVTGDQPHRRLTIIEAEPAPPVFCFFLRHRSSAHAPAPLEA